jgi:hypothetical protein
MPKSAETINSTIFSDVLFKKFRPEERSAQKNLLNKLVQQIESKKGEFTLGDDPDSYLLYDSIYFIFSQNSWIENRKEYIQLFPSFFNSERVKIKEEETKILIQNWFRKRLVDRSFKFMCFNGIRMDGEYQSELENKIENLQ